MRELTSHKVNELNDAITIHVLDEPGIGNASHVYGIGFVVGKPDNSDDDRETKASLISFQNGPIGEVGINGISQEVLLAIVEDRLIGFQSGPYSCRENSIALTKIQEAMLWLGKRTSDRMKRGVEGTHQV